ncbi:MAG: bifunctional DNA-formamidopyrimidine glycosylase/DNA-(apurinic or apyrimidinic site) lyase [Chloroflexota bacterium]
MPELPEVETTRNELSPHLVGHRITGVDLPWEGIVRRPPAAEFRTGLTGQTVTGIGRYGKYLVLSLSGPGVLVIHLKMTGSLLLKETGTAPEKFIRAVIHLNGGVDVHFRDPRKFGAMWLVADKDEVIPKLGPDPLEAGFTPGRLGELLKGRTAPIKALLCDQGVIAGIGNMYADEALFAARIHPLRPAGGLSAAEVKRLQAAIRRVLRAGIATKGASTDTYIRPSGELGQSHLQFKVAHRRGEVCPVCGTPLERIPVRNRGSYFCPHCQPAAGDAASGAGAGNGVDPTSA